MAFLRIGKRKTTSFDVPDSWETELRGRRVSLGNEDGLVIQGTELLCGGTGNCQTWVLRRSNGKWLAMFKDQAPIASVFGFQPEAHAAHKNFVIAANSSADAGNYIIYHFDGQFYRQAQCYSVHREGAQHAEKIPNDRHFLSEVLFVAGGLPAALFAHFANVFRYG